VETYGEVAQVDEKPRPSSSSRLVCLHRKKHRQNENVKLTQPSLALKNDFNTVEIDP